MTHSTYQMYLYVHLYHSPGRERPCTRHEPERNIKEKYAQGKAYARSAHQDDDGQATDDQAVTRSHQ